MIAVLRTNVVTAAGCTEPVCAALAASDAAKAAGGIQDHFAVHCCPLLPAISQEQAIALQPDFIFIWLFAFTGKTNLAGTIEF